jgi:hypothetical protein
MAKGNDDKTAAEMIDPAEPADPSINEPPKPLKVTDEKLAHVHAVLTQIASALETLADRASASHGMRLTFANIKDSLAALFDRAHQK